ncbi:MAG: right-handed parallel beta-helix repeat-containing protein [Candidatus Heimdallarchaeota archaeon]|nr:right-handed parallel beta-helix repeat-containing protein [Candidatus Heimdallarchaeota archaeon]MCK4954989.1 right-handed parallel beta-helix repeat-containing protein [Candidatus Heimdallarchaeota archaeon]
MKKKLILGIFVIGIVFCSLLIKTQAITVSFNIEDQSTESSIFSLSPTSPRLLDLSLTPHEPIEITNDGNFTDYGFQGTGEETDPYIIEGFNITANEFYGIYITNTTKYFGIHDCYINEFHYGIYIDDVAEGTASIINSICSNNNKSIYLKDSSHATLINNTCCNNIKDGIDLGSSFNSTLINNTCSDNNNNGIDLGGSSGATLINNTCNNNNNNGIDLSSSSATLINNTCSNNNNDGIRINQIHSADTLTNNTCNNNNRNGIYLVYSSGSTLTNNTCNNNFHGILLSSCSSATLTNNTCNSNTYTGILLGWSSATLTNNTCSNGNNNGIYLFDSSSCLFTYNLFQENERYGILIESNYEGNIIHHNAFVDNNLAGASQAYDLKGGNFWYDVSKKEGNYWSDWSGIGPYSIDGDAGSIDPYPLDEEGTPYFDTTAPVIDHPTDISYEEGAIDNYITWNPDDLYPSSYEVSRDGLVRISGNWFGESIVISIDGLDTGFYEYVCTVYDWYDNSISDTVIVTVTETTTEKSRFGMVTVPLALIFATMSLSLIARKRLKDR